MKVTTSILTLAIVLLGLVAANIEEEESRSPSFLERLKGYTNQTDELALLNKPDCVVRLTGGIDGVEETLLKETRDDRMWMIMIASKNDASSVAATEQWYEAVRAFCDPSSADDVAATAYADDEPTHIVEETDRKRVLKGYRFALLNFDEESQLTWRWWIWKIPIVLFVTRSTEPSARLYDVQFWKIAWKIPNTNRLIGAIKEVAWRDQLPVWDTAFTPGGKFDIVSRLHAHFFNGVYDLLDPIPRWLLALLGSMAGSMMLTWLHRNDNAQQQQEQAGSKQTKKGGASKKTQ
jgi:hypothetical protein